MSSATAHSPYAFFGDKPATFARRLPVGQLFLPDRAELDTWFGAIFERGYYTNHGPLVATLEDAIRDRLGVRHAIAVTNGTVGLMVAVVAGEVGGDVIVPSFTFPATVQALHWAGLTPVFADVEAETHMLSARTVAPHVTNRTGAVLGVHLWGRACDPAGLTALCRERGITLLYDACHGFGCTHGDTMIGHFGDAEIFSFHATKIVSAAEGGAIVTNDDALAARLRTVRNFHRAASDVPAAIRINGKMSEAQAAMALMSLGRFEEIVDSNRQTYEIYLEHLGSRDDLKVVQFSPGSSNYQYFVLEIAENCALRRDEILSFLRAEGVLARRYFSPGVHRLEPYATQYRDASRDLGVTEGLCERMMQMPVGALVSPDDAHRAAALLVQILDEARALRRRLDGVINLRVH